MAALEPKPSGKSRQKRVRARAGVTRPAPPRLSHVDARGRARMVDVGDKDETVREATASAAVRMSPATLRSVASGSGKKGDVLQVARLAGLAAIKRTADLIPLCHPLRIVGSGIELSLDRRLPGVRILATVRALDRTGVEMEALTGAAVAALTVYDMTKALERGIEVLAVRLESKSGGRSGSWRRSRSPRQGTRQESRHGKT